MSTATIDKSEVAMLALGFTPTDDIVKARNTLGLKTQDDFIKWARGTLETAAVDALKAGDMGAFERRVTQLRRYYFENPEHQAASPNMPTIMGLYLLFLLSADRTGEFHTEVEQLPEELMRTPQIQLPVAVERCIMEGNGTKLKACVSQATKDLPHSELLLQSVVNQVRIKIASSLERAYTSLNAKTACKMLLMDPNDKKSLELFAKAENDRKAADEANLSTLELEDPSTPAQARLRNRLSTRWVVEGDRLVFKKIRDDASAMPALDLISNMIALDDLLIQLNAAVHRRNVYLLREEMKPVDSEELARIGRGRSASPSETTATAASEGVGEGKKKGKKRSDGGKRKSSSDGVSPRASSVKQTPPPKRKPEKRHLYKVSEKKRRKKPADDLSDFIVPTNEPIDDEDDTSSSSSSSSDMSILSDSDVVENGFEDDDGERRFIVDSIVQFDGRKYLVKWKGYTDMTWEPPENLQENLFYLMRLIGYCCSVLGLATTTLVDATKKGLLSADCRSSMGGRVCRPFEAYMSAGGVGVVDLMHVVTAAEGACAERSVQVYTSSACGCSHLLDSLQPSHFYELAGSFAMSTNTLVMSAAQQQRPTTTAAAVIGKVRFPYPVLLEQDVQHPSMDKIKDIMVHALTAAGFNPVYTVIYDVAKDGLFAELVFSTEPLHVPVGGLTPEQHEETARAAHAALHRCLAKALLMSSAGQTASFDLQVFRGCPLDNSPMEVEGEIEILNAENTQKFRDRAFNELVSDEQEQEIRVQDFEELYRTIAQGRLSSSTRGADTAVQLVMDSLTLESRFSDLDGGRHNDLSLEDIGWKGPVGEALFFYLDSNRDGVLSRYEWQRLVMIHRAPLIVRRFALWIAHMIGDNLLPYSVEPFVTQAKDRLAVMPERYVPVIKQALDSLGAGEPSDGDYGLLRAMAGGNEMNNLVATEFYLGYGRRPRLTSNALSAAQQGRGVISPLPEVEAGQQAPGGEVYSPNPEGENRRRKHHRGGHHQLGSFIQESDQWSRLPLEFSLRKLSPSTRVTSHDFADLGKSISAPATVFSRTAYDLVEYPADKDAEDLDSSESDVLHAASKDMRNHRRISLILDSLVLHNRFKEFDTNRDGGISFQELALKPSDKAVFTVVDFDGSNSITLGELQRLAGFSEEAAPASAIMLAQKVQQKADGPIEEYVAAVMKSMEEYTGFESVEIGEFLDFDGDGYIDHHEIAMLRVLSMPHVLAKYLPQSSYAMDKMDEIPSHWSEEDFAKMATELQANHRAFSKQSFQSLALFWNGQIPKASVEAWMNAVKHRRLKRLLAVFSAVNTDAFFSNFDKNNDGHLTGDELGQWLGSFPMVRLNTVLDVVGEGGLGITRKDLQRFSYLFTVPASVKLLALSIPREDSSPSKFVKEFNVVMERIKSERTKATIRHALDLDNDGKLSDEEILSLRAIHHAELMLVYEGLLHHGFSAITSAAGSSFLETVRKMPTVERLEPAFLEVDSVYQTRGGDGNGTADKFSGGGGGLTMQQVRKFDHEGKKKKHSKKKKTKKHKEEAAAAKEVDGMASGKAPEGSVASQASDIIGATEIHREVMSEEGRREVGLVEGHEGSLASGGGGYETMRKKGEGKDHTKEEEPEQHEDYTETIERERGQGNGYQDTASKEVGEMHEDEGYRGTKDRGHRHGGAGQKGTEHQRYRGEEESKDEGYRETIEREDGGEDEQYRETIEREDGERNQYRDATTAVRDMHDEEQYGDTMDMKDTGKDRMPKYGETIEEEKEHDRKHSRKKRDDEQMKEEGQDGGYGEASEAEETSTTRDVRPHGDDSWPDEGDIHEEMNDGDMKSVDDSARDATQDEELVTEDWDEKDDEYSPDLQGGPQSRENNTWSISMHEYPSESFEKVIGHSLSDDISEEDLLAIGTRLDATQAYDKEAFEALAGKDATSLEMRRYDDLYRSFKDVRNLARVFHILDSIKMDMRFSDLDQDHDGKITVKELGCGDCKSDSTSEEECVRPGGRGGAVNDLFNFIADGFNKSSISRRNWQRLVLVEADLLPPAVQVVLGSMGDVPRDMSEEVFEQLYTDEAKKFPGAREEAMMFLGDEAGGMRNIGYLRVAAARSRLAGFLPSSFDFPRDISTVLKPGADEMDEATFEEVGRHAETTGDWFKAKSFGALLFPIGETLPRDILEAYMTARKGGYLYDLAASLGSISMAARFDAIDVNGDGLLTKEELTEKEWKDSIAGTMVSVVGVGKSGPKRNKLFTLLDLDRSGSIGRPEWQHWGYLVAQARPHMRALALGISPEVKMSAAEYAKKYRSAIESYLPDEVHLIEKHLDFDGDGVLSEPEISLLRVVGGGRALRELLYRELFFGFEIVNTGVGSGQSLLQEVTLTENDRTLTGFMGRIGAVQSPYVESARFAFQFLDTNNDGELSDAETKEFELMRMLFADYGFLRFISDFTALTVFKKVKGPAGAVSLKCLIDSAKAGDCTPSELALEIHDAFEIDLPDDTVEVPWALWRLIVWRHLTNEHTVNQLEGRSPFAARDKEDYHHTAHARRRLPHPPPHVSRRSHAPLGPEALGLTAKYFAATVGGPIPVMLSWMVPAVAALGDHGRCISDMEESVCLPFSRYFEAGGTDLPHLIEIVQAASSVCGDYRYDMAAYPQCGCNVLLEDLQPASFIQLVNSFALAPNPALRAMPVKRRTSSAAIIGEVKVHEVAGYSWPSSKIVKSTILRALVDAAGFDRDYAVVYESEKDNNKFVFSADSMSHGQSNNIDHAAAANAASWAIHNALSKLMGGAFVGNPFEVEVYRGSSLDSSPLEVEGDIEITNWDKAPGFRDLVTQILEGPVSDISNRVLKHGITGDDVLVSSHNEGILLAHEVPGPHIGFTAYADAAWGGARAHLDVLDDLRRLQVRLSQSGVESLIRVHDIRIMSGLAHRAKRALYSYCSHLDHSNLPFMAPASIAEEWGREEAQSELLLRMISSYYDGMGGTTTAITTVRKKSGTSPQLLHPLQKLLGRRPPRTRFGEYKDEKVERVDEEEEGERPEESITDEIEGREGVPEEAVEDDIDDGSRDGVIEDDDDDDDDDDEHEQVNHIGEAELPYDEQVAAMGGNIGPQHGDVDDPGQSEEGVPEGPEDDEGPEEKDFDDPGQSEEGVPEGPEDDTAEGPEEGTFDDPGQSEDGVQEGPEDIDDHKGDLEQINKGLIGPSRTYDFDPTEDVASSGDHLDPGQTEEGVAESPTDEEIDAADYHDQMEDGVLEDPGPPGDFGPGLDAGQTDEGAPEEQGPDEMFGPAAAKDDELAYNFDDDDDTLGDLARLPSHLNPVVSDDIVPDILPDSSMVTPQATTPEPTKRAASKGISKPIPKPPKIDDYEETIVEETTKPKTTATPMTTATPTTPRPTSTERKTVPPSQGPVGPFGPDLNPITDAEIESDGFPVEDEFDPVVEVEPPEPDFGPGLEDGVAEEEDGAAEAENEAGEVQDASEDGVAEDDDGVPKGEAEDGVVEDVNETLPEGEPEEEVNDNLPDAEIEEEVTTTTTLAPEKLGNTLGSEAAAADRLDPPHGAPQAEPGPRVLPSRRHIYRLRDGSDVITNCLNCTNTTAPTGPYYDPLFNIHPFAPRLVYSPPAPHPPDRVVIPMSPALSHTRRKKTLYGRLVMVLFSHETSLDAGGSDGLSLGSYSHALRQQTLHEIYEANEFKGREPTPSDAEFIIGMRGFIPPGECLGGLMQWVDNSTIHKVEEIRSFMEEVYEVEAPMHDRVVFGAFVREGLLGDDIDFTAFHRLQDGVEHLRGLLDTSEPIREGLSSALDAWLMIMRAPAKLALIKLFRDAPGDIYTLMDENNDGLVNLTEWTKFGNTIRAPAFVFTDKSFSFFATEADPEHIKVHEIDDIFQTVAKGELLDSMDERDDFPRLVSDSLALESRFSQLDNFRSFELSIDEIGWSTLSGRALFHYLDTNRDGYLSRYEWQRMVIINRAPIVVKRFAL
ncbi:26S proteasome non-ATPase regulatory subunit 8, partial [Perkinsus chesapeaki]